MFTLYNNDLVTVVYILFSIANLISHDKNPTCNPNDVFFMF